MHSLTLRLASFMSISLILSYFLVSTRRPSSNIEIETGMLTVYIHINLIPTSTSSVGIEIRYGRANSTITCVSLRKLLHMLKYH